MTRDHVPTGAAVARLRQDYPDVTHSSLHFLERLGLLRPRRTPGGHRLYSPDDLERVRQVKAWQAQRLSLADIQQRLAQRDAVGSPSDLATGFLERALDGDLPAARQIILDADTVGLPLEVTCFEILKPALWELGERWACETATVAQEKEVSEVANELIAELTLRHATPTHDASRSVVAACVAGELHELGLRMMCGVLRSRGVEVHYLGVDVVPAVLVDAVERRHPAVVLLSATGDERLPAIQAMVDALLTRGARPPVLAGGPAVVRHRGSVAAFGAVPVSDDDAAAIESVRALLGIPQRDACARPA